MELVLSSDAAPDLFGRIRMFVTGSGATKFDIFLPIMCDNFYEYTFVDFYLTNKV
jgi:hypothetical protein